MAAQMGVEDTVFELFLTEFSTAQEDPWNTYSRGKNMMQGLILRKVV